MSGTPDVARDVLQWRGRERAAWPVVAWPAPDRAAWDRALRSTDDLLDDGGIAACWRPATRRLAAWVYGRWLAHLAAAGTLDPAAAPATRVIPEAVAGFLAEVQPTLSSVTLANKIAMLVMTMKALAPEDDWDWLKRLHSSLKRRATPSRDKRSRVVAAADLFALGCDLMQQAEATAPADDGKATMTAALAFRDGLMIALLASRPLRQRNCLGTEIGRQLVRDRTGWRLRFQATETKNHQPLEVTIPRALEAALDRYLEHWRPRLLEIARRRYPKGLPQGSPAGNQLWVNCEGGALGVAGQRTLLCERTQARFGVMVNPHLFRDCVATSIAAEDPDHVRIAAQLLGHTSLQSTERYYVIADNRASLGKHQDRIQALRRGPRGSRRGSAAME